MDITYYTYDYGISFKYEYLKTGLTAGLVGYFLCNRFGSSSSNFRSKNNYS